MTPVQLLTRSPALSRLIDRLAPASRVSVGLRGSVGSSCVMVAGAIAAKTNRPVLLVTAHVDEADSAAEELASMGCAVRLFPAMEVLPGESTPRLDLFAERVALVRDVEERPDAPMVVCAPIAALMQPSPSPEEIPAVMRVIRAGRACDRAELVRWLDSAGYSRVDSIENPGDFSTRGGIIDVFPPGGRARREGPDAPFGEAPPVRLDFFGDQVERIEAIDMDTMGSLERLSEVELACCKLAPSDARVSFLDCLSPRTIVVLHEMAEIVEQARGYYERVAEADAVFGPPAVLARARERFSLVEVAQFSPFSPGLASIVELSVRPPPLFGEDPEEAVRSLGELRSQGAGVVLVCQTTGELQRASELLRDAGLSEGIDAQHATLTRGFWWEEDLGRNEPRTLFLGYHELVRRYAVRRGRSKMRVARAMDTFLEFQEGDYVVHADHGIARFVGLRVMRPRPGDQSPWAPAEDKAEAAGEAQEFFTLEFAGRSKLHVPASQIDLVQRYVGGFRGKPELSTLGGQRWKRQKERTAEAVKDLASELLRVRAARESLPGIRYPADTPWQREFEGEFPYDETEDQLAALSAIKRDMENDRPMDRLVCGDVGFGKTELAIRAAFKALEFGKQAAILVPTTVLAEQHEKTFRGRFAGFPFRVESISRFKTNKEINEVLAAVRKGHVDVVIGTHRLLSKDVKFADLGLVVIDEEQRFGVEHKEQLLRLRMTADVLTLSATPIPRTLHMSMLGLRDISSLATAPLDRLAVVTEVIPWNEKRIAQAIARELSREGQVYFVHNRVHDIVSVADDVRRLAPDARVVIGHGQMPPHELEEVMLAFTRRQADILVCTTIIESGIDIPSANTIIIDNADRFGLADLHQLRGRVGRSAHRAYCYMLLPTDRPVREVARKRLQAIEQFSMLGAGFKIAMRDLEIRGAGNLLGSEQSGHIAAVGYEMYCRLLDQAVRNLTDDHHAAPSRPSVEIGMSGLIPKSYIPSDARRMEAYRRIAVASDQADLDRVETDLTAAYGPPPTSVRRLLDVAGLQVAGARFGVRSIVAKGSDVVFRLPNGASLASHLSSQAAPRSREASWTVVALPPKEGDSMAEVYLRLPRTYFDPETLVRVLRAWLSPRDPGSPPLVIAPAPTPRPRAGEQPRRKR